MRPAPSEQTMPLPSAGPTPEADHPMHAMPATGCSGQGAASAIAHWLRQNEERERVMEPVDPSSSAASGSP